jgi:hypothetical protein
VPFVFFPFFDWKMHSTSPLVLHIDLFSSINLLLLLLNLVFDNTFFFCLLCCFCLLANLY